MAATVVCPGCWTWSERLLRTTCKRCGLPLVYADGRRVSEPPPEPPSPAPASPAPDGLALEMEPAPAPPTAVLQFAGAPLYSMAAIRPGPFDWLALARWFTVAGGAVAVAAILATGLFVRHVTLTVFDTTSGAFITRTYGVGFVVVAVAFGYAVAIAVVASLIRFSLVRALFLLLTLAAMWTAVTELEVTTGFVRTSVMIGIGLNAVWALILALTFVGPRRAAHQ
ncbi:MAG: hypothetical protein ABR498_01060 [Candidatus Dormibacteria bacterium]